MNTRAILQLTALVFLTGAVACDTTKNENEAVPAAAVSPKDAPKPAEDEKPAQPEGGEDTGAEAQAEPAGADAGGEDTGTEADPAGADAGAEPEAAKDAPEEAAKADDEPEAGTKSDAAKAEPKAEPRKAQADDGKKKEAGKAGAEVMAQGRELYMKKCKACHGTSGEADTKMGQKHEIESWKEPGWKGKWTLAKIEKIVKEGKDGTKMKAFEGKLSPEEITAVSTFARSLGK